jgi:hypothetical protein
MADIFISYRRDDSWEVAQLVRERLATWFSDGAVFMDVTDIEGGDDWRATLREHLARSNAVVVVIGKSWLTCTDVHGRRRLDRPDDIVCWEITEAFRLGKRVIPLLVDGATPLAGADLPASLHRLAGLQWVGLSNVRFDKDVETLIEAIERHGRLADLLDESRRMLRMLRTAAVIVPAICLVTFSLAWVSLFDVLRIDTLTASVTMLLGDLLWPTRPSAELVVVTLPPQPERARPGAARRDDAMLIEVLSVLGARRVVFDASYTAATPFDAELLGAIEGARRRGTEVIVGFNDRDGERPVAFDGLERAASAMGSVCIARRLGLATAGSLTIERDGAILPGLALVAAHGPVTIRRVRRDIAEVDIHTAAGDTSIRYSLLERIAEGRSLCRALSENDVGAFVLFPISARERLRMAAHQKTVADVLGRSRTIDQEFRGRIVLVGAQEAEDKLRTRLDFSGTRYGVEFQADAISALLRGKTVRALGPWGQWALMLMLGAVAVVLRLWRFGRADRARTLLMVTVPVAYTATAVILYVGAQVLVNLVYQLSAFLAAYWVLGWIRRRTSHAGPR